MRDMPYQSKAAGFALKELNQRCLLQGVIPRINVIVRKFIFLDRLELSYDCSFAQFACSLSLPPCDKVQSCDEFEIAVVESTKNPDNATDRVLVRFDLFSERTEQFSRVATHPIV